MGRPRRGRWRRRVATRGARSNDKKTGAGQAEPVDHGIGRSRGGLTTKAHLAVDGRGRPIAVLLTAGQVNDSPLFPLVLDAISVARVGPGRPRSRPNKVIADKAYSARAHRAALRRRRIGTVIPEPVDQIAHRRRRGRRGGRPPSFDADTYRGRNVIERGFNLLKQWRGIATRYDKNAQIYRGAMVLCAALIWLRH
jgi:putative transposase